METNYILLDELIFMAVLDSAVSDLPLKIVCQLTLWQYDFDTLGMAKRIKYSFRPYLNRHWRWDKIGWYYFSGGPTNKVGR
jgi:hypothetical protein